MNLIECSNATRRAGDGMMIEHNQASLKIERVPSVRRRKER